MVQNISMKMLQIYHVTSFSTQLKGVRRIFLDNVVTTVVRTRESKTLENFVIFPRFQNKKMKDFYDFSFSWVTFSVVLIRQD